MKWFVYTMLILVAVCTAGQLQEAAGVMDTISDPNVLAAITDANNADDVGALIGSVGALIGSVRLISIGAIIAGVGAVVSAVKKRK